MPTKTDLANSALTLVSMPPITNIDDTLNDVAKTVKKLFDEELDAVLRAAHWNCATWRKTLAGLQSYDQNEWAFVYQLPQDPFCLKARRFESTSNWESSRRFHPNQIPFRVEGRFILTSVESPTLIYTRRIEDMNLLDSLVRGAFETRLAARLAGALRNDYTRAEKLFAMWEKLRDEAAGLDEAEGQKDVFISVDLLADR